MKTNLNPIGWLAVAALLALPGLDGAAHGQPGPVRQGLRGAANVTGQAVRRTGEATRNIVGGVAQGTANAARRTGEAARNLGQGTRNAIRGAVQPNRGAYRSGYRGAVQSNGTYLQGQSQYVDQAQYQEGSGTQPSYSGGELSGTTWQNSSANQACGNNGQVYQLRYDAAGREYICVCGNRVYFTDQPTQHQDPQPASSETDRDQQAYESRRPVMPTEEPQADAAKSAEHGSQDDNRENRDAAPHAASADGSLDEDQNANRTEADDLESDKSDANNG